MRKIGKGRDHRVRLQAWRQRWLGTAPGWYQPILDLAEGEDQSRRSATVEGKPNARHPGRLLCRDYESNNGLYNVAVFFNGTDAEEKLDVTLSPTSRPSAT